MNKQTVMTMQWTCPGSEMPGPDQNSRKASVANMSALRKLRRVCGGPRTGEFDLITCYCLIVSVTSTPRLLMPVELYKTAYWCLAGCNLEISALWIKLNSFPNTTNKSQPIERNIALFSAADISLWRLIACCGSELLILWSLQQQIDPIVTRVTEKLTLQ